VIGRGTSIEQAWGVKRSIVSLGLLVLIALPLAAIAGDVATAPMAVAITQPLPKLMPGSGLAYPALPESGLMVLVGSGLLGLAAIVRRTTGV
jgi:hypothetical protein